MPVRPRRGYRSWREATSANFERYRTGVFRWNSEGHVSKNGVELNRYAVGGGAFQAVDDPEESR